MKLHVIALTISVFTINANAALYDRGNGMIYDSTQNITWLQDANYAKTSGYNADGLMTWDQSTAWANALVYNGLVGWRLASAGLNGTMGAFSFDGSTNYSYNNTRSEIGHLYYELGNLGAFDTSGNTQSGYGFTHTGSFLNVQSFAYWETEQYAPGSTVAWAFNTYLGNQELDLKSGGGYYAWAVRDGDVASVPVPATAWLFGSGLLGLVGAVTRKK